MSLHVLKNIGVIVVALVAAVITAGQCKNPRWLFGRLYLWLMNRTHSGLTTWGLSHLSIGPADEILDIGCGGGRAVRSLAMLAPGGKATGIDHSTQSVAASRRVNSDLIATGRVEIHMGSVSALPFRDQTFDVVTAIETHYYWPDPEADFRQVLRVLRPGGTFLVVAEVYKRRQSDFILPLVMRALGGSCPSAKEIEEQLISAGFSTVELFDDQRKGWLCATALRAVAERSRHDA